MQLTNPLQNNYTPGRILGPNGQPWQEAHGYEPGAAFPHVIQLAAMVQTSYQTYLHGRADEATRNDPELARAMRRDASIEGPLEERYLGTASLPWHIEIEDDKHPVRKAIQTNITKVIQSTPRLQELIFNLLEAIWYGKSAVQPIYKHREFTFVDAAGQQVRGKAPAIAYHEPVHGDSIGYRWDRTPYILANASAVQDIPNACVINTTKGRGLLLMGSFRSRFIMHHHRSRAADFFDIDRAEAIHGVGVRDVLYWTQWLRNEWLGNIADWCERTGLGVRVWYYQMGNAKSKEEVLAAAKNQTDRTNLLIPRSATTTGKSSEGVEFVDTSGTGAELLLKLINYLDQIKERYMIGQSLSSKSEGGGLGGSGVADLHSATKGKIIASDANALADSLTVDFVRLLMGWMYPKEDPAIARWVFDIERPDPDKILNAVNTAYSMGVTFGENDVRKLTTVPPPAEGDRVLQQQQQQPGMGMDGGMGGDMGQPQDEDFESVMAEMAGAA